MKSEKEIRNEARKIRDRVKQLSGFWIGEASAAIYALEWAIDKRDAPPSEDIGKARGGREKIAASLVKLAETTPSVRLKPKKAPGKKGARRPV